MPLFRIKKCDRVDPVQNDVLRSSFHRRGDTQTFHRTHHLDVALKNEALFIELFEICKSFTPGVIEDLLLRHKVVRLDMVLEMKNKSGEIIFLDLCRYVHEEILNICLNYIPSSAEHLLKAQDSMGNTSLLILYEQGKWKVLEKVLAFKSCTSNILNIRNSMGLTLLERACADENVELVQCIVSTRPSEDVNFIGKIPSQDYDLLDIFLLKWLMERECLGAFTSFTRALIRV